MKILFMVDNYGKKMFANGICVNELVKSFTERGHSITIISQDTGDINKFNISKDKIQYIYNLIKLIYSTYEIV